MSIITGLVLGVLLASGLYSIGEGLKEIAQAIRFFNHFYSATNEKRTIHNDKGQ